MNALEHLPLFIFLSLLAEILGTIGGFGSSLFFVPIASYFIDLHSVLGITAMFHVMSNITKLFFFRKGFDKKLIFSIGIPAVIFVVLGAVLGKYIQTKILEILLAIFLIGVSLMFLIFKDIVLKPTLFKAIGGGALSGFIAGLIGTGGAIRGITLAAFNLTRDSFIATSALIDLGIDSSRGVVYYLNGYVHRDDLYLLPMLLVASILGTYIGKKILAKMSEKQFKQTVLVLVLITGLISLGKILFPSIKTYLDF